MTTEKAEMKAAFYQSSLKMEMEKVMMVQGHEQLVTQLKAQTAHLAKTLQEMNEHRGKLKELQMVC